jgi:hypothetical protein
MLERKTNKLCYCVRKGVKGSESELEVRNSCGMVGDVRGNSASGKSKQMNLLDNPQMI